VQGAGEEAPVSGAPRIEDFYDVPPVEVLLSGGPLDGRRMRVHGEPFALELERPRSLPSISDYAPGRPIGLLSDRTVVYLRTGSIRDDGARVYMAEGRRR
jgi:hypothetical protein